ncbi:MAG TPA: twin-arginine translocase TatA/TatE family subunit [Candidatus Latescibacteria bacterium]|nr:twin-arginine translocase TatA/TatE family subunit [Candidatus Latescibacterota bacterium]
MLPNVGPWEMIVILLVAFLVFGSKRLPEVARGIGKGIREFRREISGVTDEINGTRDAVRNAPPPASAFEDESEKKEEDARNPSDPVIL